MYDEQHKHGTESGSGGRPAARAERAPAKLIRSDVIRYPGAERVEHDSEYERWKASGRRLQPMRDTGLHVERRALRDVRRRTRVRRERAVLSVCGIVALVAVAIWGRSILAPKATQGHGAAPSGIAVASASDEPAGDPTPLFATYEGIELRLPVAVGDLTELGFHQASYSYALHMKALLPAADMTAAKREKGTRRDVSAQEAGENAVLTGSTLVMWRDRPGKPDTAVDVGAIPGTEIMAPVSGTVVLVKKYSLYNKYPDVQVHIQPDGHPGLDLVLIHVQNPAVKAGDKVHAGLTPLGEVRKLSDKMALQLRTYTGDGGDHVHVQLNNARHPDYEGLDGAITVSGS